jgi:hypothetical protein
MRRNNRVGLPQRHMLGNALIKGQHQTFSPGISTSNSQIGSLLSQLFRRLIASFI